MKILFTYLSKKIICHWIATLLALITILVLGDSLSQIKNLAHLPLPEILQISTEFYMTRIPNWMTLIIPLSSVIGISYTVAQLCRSREWIALTSGGLSIRSTLIPILLFFSICFGALQWVNREIWIPSVSEHTFSLKEKVKDQKSSSYSLVQGITENGHQLQGTWLPEERILKDILIISPHQITVAEEGSFKKTFWHLKNITQYQPQATAQPYRIRTSASWNWESDLSPTQLQELFRDYDEMSHQQLLKQIEKFPQEWELRVASLDRLYEPATSFTLVFTSIPLLLMGLTPLTSHIRIFLITIVFFIVQTVSYRMGVEKTIPLFLASSLPHGLYFISALILWKKIKT